MRTGEKIALTALVLSVFNAGWAALGYMKGPDVEMYPPTTVELRCCAPGESVYITGSTINYVNRGREQYGAVIRWEEARVIFPNMYGFTLDWFYFSNVTTSGSSHKVVTSVFLPGASAVGHETQFYPRLQPCEDAVNCTGDRSRVNYYSFRKLGDLLADPNKLPYIDLRLTSTILARTEESKTADCRIHIDLQKRRALERMIFACREIERRGGRCDLDGEYVSLPCTDYTSDKAGISAAIKARMSESSENLSDRDVLRSY